MEVFDIASGLQAHDRPGPARKSGRSVRGQLSRPGKAVMDARSALLPEFDIFGPQAIAAPVRRPRDGVIRAVFYSIGRIWRTEAPGGGRHSRDEVSVRADALALSACPRGDAARPRARGN